MNQFQDFGLPALLNEALVTMGYTEPTPIQAQTIPAAMLGKDILGSAQTGTGKTAAFMLPLIAQLLKDTEKTALILTPTRELAAQILVFTQKLLGRKSFINTTLLIGGEPMFPQLSALRRNPRIIVGTPGRVNDHLSRGTLSLKKTGVFVLDEADRMLDMGFGIQIEAIAEHLPVDRQTMLFSATLPSSIMKLTQQYLKNPENVHIESAQITPANIQQDTLNVTSENKFTELLKELDKRSGSVIIFVKTKHGTEKLARSLKDEGHSTDFLHGDLRQNRRSKVIKDFRDSKNRIMIATDVAARGLDIPHIEHVINYDLPQCPEDYIHRIGRTARAGAKGFSLCLIAPQDRRLWAAIQHMLDPKKNQKPMGPRSGGSSYGNRRGGSSSGGGRSSYFTGHSRSDSRGGDSRGGFGGSSYRQDGDNKPSGERREYRRDDRPARDDRGSFTPRPSFDRSSSDRPAGERRDDRGGFTPRPSFDRSSSDRPAGERRDDRGGFTPRPRPASNFDRSSSDRPAGERRDDRGGFTPRPRPFGERRDDRKDDSRDNGFRSSPRSSSDRPKTDRGGNGFFDRDKKPYRGNRD